METVITVIVIALMILGASAYVIKSKKSGKKCIGCPDGCCSSCQGCPSSKNE